MTYSHLWWISESKDAEFFLSRYYETAKEEDEAAVRFQALYSQHLCSDSGWSTPTKWWWEFTVKNSCFVGAVGSLSSGSSVSQRDVSELLTSNSKMMTKQKEDPAHHRPCSCARVCQLSFAQQPFISISKLARIKSLIYIYMCNSFKITVVKR